ncbi:putative peptidase M76, ATP23 [Lupinus albus]|uniref:Mitochondrial inner membrane protease ATP23 n=1 Tax=Lupinus albus TaxID=3870 RepID=A0A6A4R2U0_LUPAL|nr:putative peptidase M76, ATP23 [Lupinus albus]
MADKPTSSVNVRRIITNEECQAMIQKSLRTPMVRFLRQQLEKAGCPIGDNFFRAVYCHQKMQGAYISGEGVTVCTNYIRIQDEVNQVVTHELIHAYDDCRAANLEWTSCAHHACSEVPIIQFVLNGIKCDVFLFLILPQSIFLDVHVKQIRAAHLSGDCHYKRELLRGFTKFGGQGKECIRRRVMQSLATNPDCAGTAAKDTIEAVWDKCYNDKQPFDREP